MVKVQTQRQSHKNSVAIVRAYTFDLFYLFHSLIKPSSSIGIFSEMIKKGGGDRPYEEDRNSEMMSQKEVEVDCVIFFYQKGKCGDNYISKERARLRLKENQDLAELKREIR